MESLFLLAFGEEEFFIALAMACSEAFFNKLLIGEVKSARNHISGNATYQALRLRLARIAISARFASGVSGHPGGDRQNHARRLIRRAVDERQGLGIVSVDSIGLGVDDDATQFDTRFDTGCHFSRIPIDHSDSAAWVAVGRVNPIGGRVDRN